MSKDVGFRLTQGGDQCRHVIAEGLERVILDPSRSARLAKASHVRRHRPVSGPGQGRDEVAVKQDDQRTRALRQAVEADAVRCDEVRPHPDVSLGLALGGGLKPRA